MAHFNLSISGDLTDDDDRMIFALLAGKTIAAGPGPAPADASGLSAADEPKRAVRKGAKAAEGSKPDETAASPSTEPPTPKVQQTDEQQKAVDPGVAAAQAGGDTGAAGSTKQVEQVEETKPAPSAKAPGDVTLDDLKVLLTKAMGFNAAKTLQDVIRATAGVPGLSQAEAKDYPALHEALKPYSEGEVKPA